MAAECRLPSFVIIILTVTLFCIALFSADCEVGMSELQKGYQCD